MATSTSTIVIDAPADRVWGALTTPELVKQWQYGSDLMTDWQVGSSIRFRTAWQDQVLEQWGTVQDYQPEQRLTYTLFAPRPGLADSPENYFSMTYLLEPDAEGTRLSVVQQDTRPGASGEDTVTDGDDGGPLTVLKSLVEASPAGLRVSPSTAGRRWSRG